MVFAIPERLTVLAGCINGILTNWHTLFDVSNSVGMVEFSLPNKRKITLEERSDYCLAAFDVDSKVWNFLYPLIKDKGINFKPREQILSLSDNIPAKFSDLRQQEKPKAVVDVWLHAPEQKQETYKTVWMTRNKGYSWEIVAQMAFCAESTARKYYKSIKAWRENPPKT